jgi:hypothetical protein
VWGTLCRAPGLVRQRRQRYRQILGLTRAWGHPLRMPHTYHPPTHPSQSSPLSPGRASVTDTMSRSGNQLGPDLGRLAVLALTRSSIVSDRNLLTQAIGRQAGGGAAAMHPSCLICEKNSGSGSPPPVRPLCTAARPPPPRRPGSQQPQRAHSKAPGRAWGAPWVAVIDYHRHSAGAWGCGGGGGSRVGSSRSTEPQQQPTAADSAWAQGRYCTVGEVVHVAA